MVPLPGQTNKSARNSLGFLLHSFLSVALADSLKVRGPCDERQGYGSAGGTSLRQRFVFFGLSMAASAAGGPDVCEA